MNNFIINNTKEKIEKINNDRNNYIIFEGSDFSFNDDINENIIKNIKKVNILKLKNICIYKNDKLKISKLNNILNNKEIITINNIENKRKKLYIFEFTLDEYKIKNININNNITNKNIIEKNYKFL